MEEWKDVVGYEGFYQVSNLGVIKSIFYNDNKIMKQQLNKNGYFMVILSRPNHKKTLYVHRIVAEAFIPKELSKTFINHKNEVKTDNYPNNLEWCTQAYNNTFNGKVQRCCKPINQFTLSGEFISWWKSARKINEILGIEYKNISSCCRGKRNKAGGYKWEFAEVS